MVDRLYGTPSCQLPDRRCAQSVFARADSASAGPNRQRRHCRCGRRSPRPPSGGSSAPCPYRCSLAIWRCRAAGQRDDDRRSGEPGRQTGAELVLHALLWLTQLIVLRSTRTCYNRDAESTAGTPAGRPSELAKRCQLVIGIPLGRSVGRSRLVRRMRNLFLLRTPVTTVPS
jgi:hypothetical protein